MYRCPACDAPSQARCGCAKKPTPAPETMIDLYDWPEEPMKLDIQAGVRVAVVEEPS